MARSSGSAKKPTPGGRLAVVLISVALVLVLKFIPGASDYLLQFLDIQPSVPTVREGEMAVHFIDVGQGDASLVILPSGETMLIDAGPTASAEDLCAYLDALRVTSLDYAVFTHPHEDHIGGAAAVLDHVNVKQVVMPDVTANTSCFNRLVSAIDEHNISLIIAESGKKLTFGEAIATILGPVHIDPDNLNNDSIVLHLTFGSTSFLFMGDAEWEEEEDILSTLSASKLDCDVLKVGHHGSSSSTSQAWFDLISPSHAVITCGKNNDYGHPHREIVSLFKKYNVPTYRTDLLGSFVFASDGTTVTPPNAS